MIDRICHLIKQGVPELNGGLLSASGATVPVDGTAGYQTGCTFNHTDGGAATAFYINEGSVTSCDFNAVDAGAFTGPIILSGAATDAVQITGTYDRAFNLSAYTVGTTTDGVIMRVGSGIGTSALAMPDGARGLAIYLRNVGASGTLTGMRLRGVSDPASASNGLDVLHVQAEVVASKDATAINSGFFEVVPKGTNVIGYIRGLLVNIDSGASQTVSTQQVVAHFRVHTRGDETMSGTDEMLYLQNEAVGGNGRQLDSFIRCDETSMSGGIKAAGYLIDAGVSTSLLATAVLRVPDDSGVCHSTDTGSGTDLQFSDLTGYLTVVVGTATRYIPLLTNKPSALS